MPVLTNPRYEAFAILLAQGESATKAYVSAGFTDSGSAAQNASRLIKKEHVRIRVAELRSLVADTGVAKANESLGIAAISRARVLQRLTTLGAKAEESKQLTAAIRAEELIGKELGMFKDNVQVSGPDGGPIDNNVNVRFVE